MSLATRPCDPPGCGALAKWGCSTLPDWLTMPRPHSHSLWPFLPVNAPPLSGRAHLRRGSAKPMPQPGDEWSRPPSTTPVNFTFAGVPPGPRRAAPNPMWPPPSRPATSARRTSTSGRVDAHSAPRFPARVPRRRWRRRRRSRRSCLGEGLRRILHRAVSHFRVRRTDRVRDATMCPVVCRAGSPPTVFVARRRARPPGEPYYVPVTMSW